MQLTEYSYASLHGPYLITLIWGDVVQSKSASDDRLCDVSLYPYSGGDGETCEMPAATQVSDIGVIVQAKWLKSGRRNRAITFLAKDKLSPNFIPVSIGAVPGLSVFAIAAVVLTAIIALLRLPLLAIVPVALLCLTAGYFYTAKQTQKVVREAQRAAAAQFRAKRDMNQRLKPRRRGLYVVEDVSDTRLPPTPSVEMPRSG